MSIKSITNIVVTHCPKLLVVDLVAMVHLGVTWRLGVVALFDVGISIAVEAIPLFHHNAVVLSELKHFLWQFRDCSLTPIPMNEYAEALMKASPNERVIFMSGMKSVPLGKVGVLPGLAQALPNHIRLVRISRNETTNSKVPGVLTTFSTINGAWIFITEQLSQFGPLDHWKVLHEIGHAALSNMTPAISGQLGAWVPVLLAPMIWLKLGSITGLQAAGLLSIVALWVVSALFYQRKNARSSGLYAELAADKFAFERCGVNWFEKYKRTPDRTIAERLCQDPGGASTLGQVSPDATPKPAVSVWLTLMLAICASKLVWINHVLKGFWPNAAVIVLVSLMALASFYAVLQYHRNRRLNLVIMGGFKLLGFLMDLRKYTRRKWFNLVAHLRSLQRCKTAPGTSLRLLFPGEFSVQIDGGEFAKGKGTATIVHTCTIEYQSIDHFLYSLDDCWCAALMNDGTRQDLGVRIDSKLRPYWERATKVVFYHTNTNTVLNSASFPLKFTPDEEACRIGIFTENLSRLRRGEQPVEFEPLIPAGLQVREWGYDLSVVARVVALMLCGWLQAPLVGAQFWWVIASYVAAAVSYGIFALGSFLEEMLIDNRIGIEVTDTVKRDMLSSVRAGFDQGIHGTSEQHKKELTQTLFGGKDEHGR